MVSNNLNVLALQLSDLMLVSTEEDQVIYVDLMARPVDEKVGSGDNPITGLETSRNIEQMFVAGLGEENRVRPTHREGGAAGIDEAATVKANQGSGHGR
jgi:hypothetical protein